MTLRLRETRSSSGTAAALEIRVLGPFEVRLGGARIDVSGGKRNAFLSVLGPAAGRAVGAQELIDALWG